MSDNKVKKVFKIVWEGLFNIGDRSLMQLCYFLFMTIIAAVFQVGIIIKPFETSHELHVIIFIWIIYIIILWKLFARLEKFYAIAGILILCSCVVNDPTLIADSCLVVVFGLVVYLIGIIWQFWKEYKEDRDGFGRVKF
jgi:hypothetical protein